MEPRNQTAKDFAAAARALIARGWTHPQYYHSRRKAAGYWSVPQQLAPELFRAAIAEVPFVDVLTTMLDDIAADTSGIPEWGNPIESATDYATIKAYAITRMVPDDYPHIWRPAARDPPSPIGNQQSGLRAAAGGTDDGLTLLRTEMTASTVARLAGSTSYTKLHLFTLS